MLIPMDITEKAGAFLREHGRPIDQAIFAYHFANGSRDDLLAALGTYQHLDGGFGHALEPDITAPESNPFATEIALQICIDAKVSPDEPLLRRAVEYLEMTQDEEGNWRFTSGIYEHEIAPWFAGWEWPNLNPSCTIASLLRELSMGSEQLHARVASLFERLAKPEEVAEGEIYTVRPYAYYFLTPIEHPQREFYLSGVLWWLIRQDVKGDEEAFTFAYIRSPETFIGRNLPSDIVTRQLDHLVASQSDDGGWPTPYAEHWRGYTTAQNLLTLRAFGRL